MRRRTITGPCLSLFLLIAPLTAWGETAANEVTVTYFTAAAVGDPDFDTTGCCVVVPDLVATSLGPGGLPVLNPKYRNDGDSHYAVSDVDQFGQITWWSAGPTITQTSTGTARLPFRNHRFFPPDGAGRSDARGFQTAIFSGILHVPADGTVAFHLGSDDVGLLYLDGVLIADQGGIHSRIDTPVTAATTAGDHCLALFYADLHRIGAELVFSIDTSGVTVSPAPILDETGPSPVSTACGKPIS